MSHILFIYSKTRVSNFHVTADSPSPVLFYYLHTVATCYKKDLIPEALLLGKGKTLGS